MRRDIMSRQTPGQLEWLLPGEQFTGILPRRKAWPANAEIVPKEFVVPQNVLSTGPCRTTDPKTGLLSLPMELLVEVFRSGTNEDAICLALTCKALLFASTLTVKHRPTLPPSNRTSFHHFQTATRFDAVAHRSRETMIRFLLRLSPLGPGRRASPAVSLCQDCLRYRPVDPRWWTTDKGAPCPEHIWNRDAIRRGFQAIFESKDCLVHVSLSTSSPGSIDAKSPNVEGR
ncbi:hypothetical protein MKX07_000324 [Trichoderma sp. CBMAI-0711]|nr:hypothetical protein MKX07_000324 [Trichoderma sp. CBMAI-0711]